MFWACQRLRIISGLKTNFNPSLSYSSTLSTIFFFYNIVKIIHVKNYNNSLSEHFTQNVLQHTSYLTIHTNLFQEVNIFLCMYLGWSLYTLYLLARQVESSEAIQVFVVVSLVCRALLFPFVCCFFSGFTFQIISSAGVNLQKIGLGFLTSRSRLPSLQPKETVKRIPKRTSITGSIERNGMENSPITVFQSIYDLIC